MNLDLFADKIIDDIYAILEQLSDNDKQDFLTILQGEIDSIKKEYN